jgi:long-chain fatty acid transport protein
MSKRLAIVAALLTLLLGSHPQSAWCQGYGTDTQNVLTPAAGGMAGVSVARPQDVPAAIFGNPATLAQFQGTQFTLGGAWVEGYPTVSNDGSASRTGDTPFSVTSRSQGFVVPAIGVAQDLRSLGLPGTLGVGLNGQSGLGAEYRGRVPESDILNNTTGEYMVLGMNMGAGFQLSDKLSAGAALTLGTAFEQLGLVGPAVSSAMVSDYGLRGTFGLDYDVNETNTVGVYYQTRMDFAFPNAVRLGSDFHDVRISQPETVGIGYANRSLMNGDLLLAADFYYKMWESAPLWEDIFVNQWAAAVGAQLTRGKMKYRLGYSYNSNPINHSVGDSLDGFPYAQANVQLFQAASTAVINQHRITGGIGRQDFLFPKVDLDLFAGGLFNATDDFGPHTQASVAVYYAGMGLTWRYGDCCRNRE